jgi:chemotaxis protein MotB
MKSAEWIDPKGGAYGPEGYVAQFGQPDPLDTTEEQTVRMRKRAHRDEPVAEESDDNDWTVTYTDMVTLLMAFFVMLTTMALIQKNDGNPASAASTTPPARESSSFKPTPYNPVNVAVSPFDGSGITVVEGGTPANLDPEDEGYESVTASQSRRPPQPAQQQQPTPQQKAAEAANAALAQRLQTMVQQNNLGGQVEVVSGAASVTVRISDRILFQSGKAALEGAGQELISRLLPMLNQPGQILSVEGHTDNIPISTAIYPSNWELSAARAATVLRQLVALGLPADRLRAIAYADTKPVGANDSPEHRATNRRVELVITGDTTPATQP